MENSLVTFPIKVNSYADYKRVLEVADRFNADRPDLPIQVNLAGQRIEEELSGEPPEKGQWYLDIISSSPARLQFFTDEIQRLERDARKLEKMLKLPPPQKVLALPEPVVVVEEVIVSETKTTPKKRSSRKKQTKPIEPELSDSSDTSEEDPLASAFLKLVKDDIERQE